MERPCKVNGSEAICHGIFIRSRVVEPSPMIGGHQGGTVAYPVAVIEYVNGKTVICDVGEVVFLNGEDRFNQLLHKEV